MFHKNGSAQQKSLIIALERQKLLDARNLKMVIIPRWRKENNESGRDTLEQM